VLIPGGTAPRAPRGIRFWLMGHRRGTAAATGLVLSLVLTVPGCSASSDESPATSGASAGAASSSAATSAGASTPTSAETPRRVTPDQQFSFDETARYDDGLQIEIAGTVADKAKQTDRGAEATRGEIVIASVRIENGTPETFPAADVLISASHGSGKDAQIIIDKTDQLQSGFRGSIKKGEEQIAAIGFAVPFSELGKVTVVVDPNDDVHDPVNFTGTVERG
jgi:hypothetical protein